MKEERPWGWYEVIDQGVRTGEELLVYTPEDDDDDDDDGDIPLYTGENI